MEEKKFTSLLETMAKISGEISDTNFGKNPLTDDIQKLENIYTRWLLVIDDISSYLLFNQII